MLSSFAAVLIGNKGCSVFTKDSTFYSIGLYNTDIGPHISYGKFNKELNRIEFTENETSRYYLNLVNKYEHNWSYEMLKDGEWKIRDLVVIFRRSSD